MQFQSCLCIYSASGVFHIKLVQTLRLIRGLMIFLLHHNLITQVNSGKNFDICRI